MGFYVNNGRAAYDSLNKSKLEYLKIKSLKWRNGKQNMIVLTPVVKLTEVQQVRHLTSQIW